MAAEPVSCPKCGEGRTWVQVGRRRSDRKAFCATCWRTSAACLTCGSEMVPPPRGTRVAPWAFRAARGDLGEPVCPVCDSSGETGDQGRRDGRGELTGTPVPPADPVASPPRPARRSSLPIGSTSPAAAGGPWSAGATSTGSDLWVTPSRLTLSGPQRLADEVEASGVADYERLRALRPLVDEALRRADVTERLDRTLEAMRRAEDAPAA